MIANIVVNVGYLHACNNGYGILGSIDVGDSKSLHKWTYLLTGSSGSLQLIACYTIHSCLHADTIIKLYISTCFNSIVAVVDCGPLNNPGNGRVVLTGTTFGSTATYSCQKGFALVGSSTRTCQANRVWSGQAPVCQGRS